MTPKFKKKKDSALSTAACVLALFTCTAPIAMILAIIDLASGDKKKKHTGSIFALIYGAIVMLVFFPSVLGIKSGSLKSSIGTNEKQIDKLLCQDENVAIYLDHIKGGKIYIRYVNFSEDDINVQYKKLTINEDKYYQGIFVYQIYAQDDDILKLSLYDKDGASVSYNYETGEISGTFSYFKGGIGFTTELEFKDIDF